MYIRFKTLWILILIHSLRSTSCLNLKFTSVTINFCFIYLDRLEYLCFIGILASQSIQERQKKTLLETRNRSPNLNSGPNDFLENSDTPTAPTGSSFGCRGMSFTSQRNGREDLAGMEENFSSIRRNDVVKVLY